MSSSQPPLPPTPPPNIVDLPEDGSLEELDDPVKVLGFVVPPGTLRIRVVDSKGAIRWRKLNEVRPDDAADLDKEGRPTFMSRPLGRPSKLELHDVMPPATPVVGDLIRVKASQMRTDTISQVVESTPESADVLHQVMLGMTEEQASLRFERMEAERNGQETSQLSMRRVQALKAIGDAWIKRREQVQSRAIDIESPAFEALLRLLAETFALAMQDVGVRDEVRDSIFANFSKRLDDDWKTEAKSRMKDT